MREWASKMIQWVKTFASKSVKMSFTLRTHSGRREPLLYVNTSPLNQSLKKMKVPPMPPKLIMPTRAVLCTNILFSLHGLGMIPALKMLKQKHSRESEASLGYMTSSRPV